MEVVAFKMKPKNTFTRTVHGTKNKQYICLGDLEKTLRVPRINIRGKKSVKLNANGKQRRFLHTQHLERIIGRKPSTNHVGCWLRALFLDKTIPEPKPEPEVVAPVPTPTPLRDDALREEAKLILSENSAGWREFLIRAFDLQEHQDELDAEEARLREIDRKRETGEDQKIEELPDTVEPQKWSKDKVYFRWIEHEGLTWLEVDPFCASMKYGVTNCSFGYKPRDFDGPYLAEHRGTAYVNANVLRWHRLRVPTYDKARRAVLEHFMG